MISRGRMVSPGFASGTAFVVDGRTRLEAARLIAASDPPAIQIERLNAAASRATAQLDNVRRRLVAMGRQRDAPIFEAHAGLLADPSLRRRIETGIQEQQLSAEAAVAIAVLDIEKEFLHSESSLLRDKATDVIDIGQRLLSCLRHQLEMPLADGSVIFAHSLTPSELVLAARCGVKAIVSETCGSKSHTAILARGFAIPMIAGIESPTELVEPGTSVFVDGNAGIVIYDPTPEEQLKIDSATQPFQQVDQKARSAGPPEEPITLDDVRLNVLLNISDPMEAHAVAQLEADGVGLYRTEFLYMNHLTWPTVAESVEVYQAVVAAIGDRELCIRLADFGAEKCPAYADFAINRNPSLGIRGVRLLLSRDDILKPQVTALAKVATQRPVTVLLPMIDTVDTLTAIVKRICRHCGCRNRSELPFRLGAMIEVPSAALLIEDIIQRVDSISVGLNDLTQYLLAADRDDEMLESYHDALQPVVLRLIERVIRVADESGTPVTMCGELAGTPALASVLIGLGARRFSVSQSHYRSTIQLIRTLNAASLQSIALEALKLGSANDVRRLLKDIGGQTSAPMVTYPSDG